MIRRIIGYMMVLLVVYVTINICTPFLSFFHQRSIENQIEYLKDRFNNGADQDEQLYYPEGQLFSNAIFALALIEYESNKASPDTNNIKFVDNLILKMLSKECKSNFHEYIEPKYGAFYLGWTNFVLKKFSSSKILEYSSVKNLVKSSKSEFDSIIIKGFCDTLILDTYYGGAWPADNLVCLASIDDNNIQKDWITMIKEVSQGSKNLIPHKFGSPSEIRGCSQSLMIYFLNQINKDYANDQNQNFNKIFTTRTLGVDFIKEHEKSSYVDADSGPVIFNIGSVATIMNIKTQSELQSNNSKMTWGFLNLCGIPINLLGKKYYLFQQVMMFDIFMLWCSINLN